MQVDPDDFTKLKGIFGPNFTKATFEKIKNEMAASQNPVEKGDSGLTPATLPDFLPHLPEGKTASDTESDSFQAFRKGIESDIEMYFRRIPPLSYVTAFKWLEVFHRFFSKDDNLLVILTTKDYQKADFDKCELSLGYRKFQGTFSIRNAAQIVDTALVKYLSDNDLIGNYVFQDINTRTVWLDIHCKADPLDTEPVEQFFDDAITFWGYQRLDLPDQMYRAYHNSMSLKYDQILMDFMGYQGCIVFLLWKQYKDTDQGRPFLKTLAAHHAEYRSNPQPFQGHKTIMKKFKEYGFDREYGFKRRPCS